MTMFPTPERSEGSPLQILRAEITESAQGTLTELIVPVPSNPANRIGVLVRHVMLVPEPVVMENPAADAVNEGISQMALSTRQGEAAMPRFDDEGCIAAMQLVQVMSSAPADAGVALTSYFTMPVRTDFSDGGLLTVTRRMSLYIIDAAQTAAIRGQLLMAYHLVQIDDTDLLASLSTEVDV